MARKERVEVDRIDELVGDSFSKKSMEDFKKTVKVDQEEQALDERRISGRALQVLRYILRKGGGIDTNTIKARFSPIERKATQQLIDAGWLEKEEGIWRSPSFQVLSFLLGIFSVLIFFSLASEVLVFPVLIALKTLSTFLLFTVILPALFLIFMFGTFYSHWFEKVTMPKRSSDLLVRWARAMGRSIQYYGPMEGEEEERIRSRVLSRLLPGETEKEQGISLQDTA